MSSTENKELSTSTAQPSDMAMGVFSSAAMYGEYYRIATNLASSTLIPPQFQGSPSNVMIALNLSSRMNADPLAVMQSMYIVHNRPSFSASFIGGILDESGKFDFLDYQYQGEPGTDDYGCRIVTTVKSSGHEIQGPLITVRMAKAEGWWTRNGSKWPTLTETMLGNRAITFFARRYAGSILLGMSSNDELEDMKDINPSPAGDKPTRQDLKDSLVGEFSSDVPRGTSDKQAEEKPEAAPESSEKPSKPKQAAKDERDAKKAKQDDPAAKKDEAPAGDAAPEETKSANSDNPFTLQDLLESIEDATCVEDVNAALASTKGFSKEDSNKVLKAAGAKNKELVAARKQK